MDSFFFSNTRPDVFSFSKVSYSNNEYIIFRKVFYIAEILKVNIFLSFAFDFLQIMRNNTLHNLLFTTLTVIKEDSNPLEEKKEIRIFAFLTFTEVKLVKLLLSLYNYSREERWLSGRRRPPGERVDRRRTCLVGSNPTLSAKFASNRAKRGDSGALYL